MFSHHQEGNSLDRDLRRDGTLRALQYPLLKLGSSDPRSPS